ncbi:MAG: DUF177 domain-containing protein [Fibrobacteres bacterium]|nr:DUF177 domain-containing protein [Fibrobacterota bacterium]
MNIDIRSLEPGDNQMSLPIPKEEIDASIAKLASDGNLELAIFHSDVESTVVADLTASVELSCARCLCEFEMEITSQFTVALRKGKPGTISEDSDVPVIFYDAAEGLADITAVVADEIGVNIPMQTVCDDDCKGLCVKCGADLNEETCNCEKEAANPVWDKLKKLNKES